MGFGWGPSGDAWLPVFVGKRLQFLLGVSLILCELLGHMWVAWVGPCYPWAFSASGFIFSHLHFSGPSASTY